jgi:hypothetical protein
VKAVLIDADIIAYRSAFVSEDKPTWHAKGVAGDLISSILFDCFYPASYTLGEDVFLYLTGAGNFRYELATIKPYKGNRVGKEKPRHLSDVRDYLVSEWGAVVIEGQEADDAIATKATELGGNCVIVSVDKDFLQVPSTMYDFTKKKWTKVNKQQGNRFFYLQLLTGDVADNIPGVKGVGPKKAEKAYEGCTNEKEYFDVALKMYDGDLDALVENARLLWLRRKPEEMWEPPKCSNIK